MDISNIFNEDSFKNDLRARFVSLLESKRGIQSVLAKSIGKPAGYFSDVKRGSPVNAIHLKAVGLVFGYEKVIELLDMSNKPNSDLVDKSINFTDVSLADVAKEFIQKDLAKECNSLMIELEKIDPSELAEVKAFIDFRISKKLQQAKGYQVEGDRRKKDISYNPDRRKQVG